jgi:outer membrane protein
MNKTGYKIITFIFVSFLLSEMKMGYLNVDKVLSELDEVRQVSIELQKEQGKIEAEFQNLQFELDSLFRNYEQQKMLMSDERRQKTETTITNKRADLEKFQMEQVGPQGQIYKIQDQLMAPIYTKMDNAVTKIGKEEGYDYIFNVASGQIVYALPQYDVTQKVIDELEKISNMENE